MRMGKAKRMKNILTRKNLYLGLQVRLVWCYIMPILLYGMESWVASRELEECIEVLVMFTYHLVPKK